MNFSPFFYFLNVVKSLHWAAKKHSQHKVLDDAYDEFSDKIDEFVECYLGSTDNSNIKYEIHLDFSFDNEPEELIYKFDAAFDDFNTAIQKYAIDDHLDSLIDDLNNIYSKTKYLLKMTIED